MSWGLGDALAGSVLVFVVPSVVVSVVLVVTGRDDLEGVSLAATALLQVPLWVGLGGIPLLVSRRKGLRTLAADFGLAMRWSDVPIGLATGLGAQLALGVVVQVVYRAVGVDVEEVGASAEELAAEAHGALGVVLLVLIVALAAPVLEELFYRGLWLRALERRWGTAVAVGGSALVFAALHLLAYDLLPLFGFGLLAGTLTVRTGRLGAAICAHVAFNLTAVVALLA